MSRKTVRGREAVVMLVQHAREEEGGVRGQGKGEVRTVDDGKGRREDGRGEGEGGREGEGADVRVCSFAVGRRCCYSFSLVHSTRNYSAPA